MKAKCIANRSGYEHTLTVGEEYEITDIQESVFPSDYYVIGIGNDEQGFACHLYRFDIDKATARAYVEAKEAEHADS